MNKSILLAGLASLLIGGGVFVGCSSDSDGGDGTGATSNGGAGADGGAGSGLTGNNGGTGPGNGGAGPGNGGGGAGNGGAGQGGGPATFEPACEGIPETPGSAGACVVLTGAGGAGGAAGGNECNPVTGEPCNLEAGESCDTAADEDGNLVGFQCYPGNEVLLCEACDYSDGKFCVGKTTCVGMPPNALCAQYCCTNADCGDNGTCNVGGYEPAAPGLGVCEAKP